MYTLVDFFCHQIEASVEFRQRFGQLQEVFDCPPGWLGGGGGVTSVWYQEAR